MKKLFLLFFGLVAVAIALAVVSILLSRGAGGVVSPRTLVLRLDGDLVDHAPTLRIPFVDIEPRQSVATIYRAVRRARQDDGVAALAVYLNSPRMSLAQAQELRRLLASMTASGKTVSCYLEGAGEGRNGTLAYFLASACPTISIAPASEVNLVGLYLDSTFLRGALDKLKILPQFHQAGEYKSATETYTETAHSEAAEEALDALLDDLYGQIVDAVAEGRSLTTEVVTELIDGAPYTAARALELGLVDEILYPDEFEERAVGDGPAWTPIERYAARQPLGSRVAVVFAQGVIIRGAGGVDPWTRESYLGADDLGPLLDGLAEDDSIDAVVLRIDSPGGSALASELILRQVTRLAEAKPLVVSMGGLAASGGYYIASRAATILAEPATLTGSIGVYGGKLVTGAFQEELLGVTHDTLQRGANADFYSSVEPFSEDQAARYQAQIDALYEAFLGHVSAGRGMTRDEVDSVARGRVWTGESAVARGLVDEIGGLDRAIEIAAERAGLTASSVGLAYYPQPPSLLDFLEREPLLARSPLSVLEGLAEPRIPRRLQLPEELARLARPF